jgi:dihydroorotate dehydrogenase electron transfer subunit
MKNRPVSTTATLAAKASLSGKNCLFTLAVDGTFPTPEPGQFVHVAASPELTLRRPFSVAGVGAPGMLDLLLELRGRGTRGLAALNEGASVPLMGPLGNTFTFPEPGTAAVLVAGGIGVAGLRYLAFRLVAEGVPLLMLVGARTKDGLLTDLLPEPTDDGRVKLRVSTDDGSAGRAGTVCELLAEATPELDARTRVYCCGPPAMIEEVARLARSAGVPCEALLEEIMACGVGACRGCVVETRQGYRAVCSDGPVFDVSDLVFDGGGGARAGNGGA